jgi:hypothetical protein
MDTDMLGVWFVIALATVIAAVSLIGGPEPVVTFGVF